MTAEAKARLTKTLEAHGITVIRTADYRAMSAQLARLARFERLMLSTAAGNPSVELAVEYVQRQMEGRQ